MSANMNIEKVKRNIFIRILSSIFWLIITMFLTLVIVSGVVGGMAGAGADTANLTPGEAYKAGAKAGGEKSTVFMADNSGKVLLSGLGIWLVLSVTGTYPWVSKYKKK